MGFKKIIFKPSNIITQPYYKTIWWLLLCLFFINIDTNSYASNDIKLSKSDVKSYENAFNAAINGKWNNALKYIKTPKNRLPAKALKWLYYKSSKNKATFSEITNFIRQNPDWPHINSLIQQAEQKINDNTPNELIVAWFDDNKPQTPRGVIRYAMLLKKTGKIAQAKSIIRRNWVDMDMNRAEENDLRLYFKKWIRAKDNETRLERLLWQGRIYAAKRQARRVNSELRLLANARIALRQRKGGVDNAIAKIPKKLQNHPGFIYERMRWRVKKGRDAGAIELLELGVDESQYPKLWWKQRGKLARKALKDNKIDLGYQLASNHQASSGFAFADAEWLSGWIALRYYDKPTIALEHFSLMYQGVTYPVSLARASYWAGRAASKIGDTALAQKWYQKSSHHVSSFYGQLAAAEINYTGEIVKFEEYMPTKTEQEQFNNQELTKLITMLAQINANMPLKQIIRFQIKHAESEVEFILLARLAARINLKEHSVYAAREAIKQGFILSDIGYPILDMPKFAKLNKVVAMSIIRQESAFKIDAKSRVGARGLMQLMPATAKNTAKKARMKYNKAKLSKDSEYNINLGSYYLNNLINKFNGSLPMAFAGYNAGPHRSKRWAKENGDPRLSLEKAIDWIELIPFNETQNYVQRVLENMVVYQNKINGHNIPLNKTIMNIN